MSDTDFGYAFVGRYRDGEHAWYQRKLRPAEVLVSHDQKHWVYNLSGYGKGAIRDFQDWASCNFPVESDISYPGDRIADMDVADMDVGHRE